MDEQVSTFCAFTSGTPEQAQRYLQLTDGNVEQAVELFYSSPDLGNPAAATTAAATTSRDAPTQPSRPARGDRDAPINIDDDEDMDDFNDNNDDDDLEELGSRQIPQRSGPSVEDDEAMARRLQEEMYGGGGASRGEDIRAPMARTTETLIGPGSGDWRDDPNQMNAAIAQQLMNRNRPRNQAPGIFNQQQTSSIWNTPDDLNSPEARRQALSSATGGASDSTPKANHLAELFRPPFDLISPLSLSDARDEGKESEKWILVNVQDPSIFDCQVLNRDIWKKPEIRDTIKEHFIFLQFSKTDPRGQEYVNYYMSNMRDSDDAYPHIGIVDPRTGEQVKTWSGSPSPKPADFLMEILEFLDRYSLKMEKKNPVQAKRKQARKEVAAMSEEEMLEMAMQNSLTKGKGTATFKEDDPDALTKAEKSTTQSTSDEAQPPPATEPTPQPPQPKEETPFSLIPSSNPHTEPTSTNPQETTRIQFRHSGGRVVRRFSLNDPVRRIYEWLKAEPLDDAAGRDFELIAMGKNLIEALDQTIAEAQLRNGTVMVEFVDGE
jgi:hypothetical protein